MNTNDIRLNAQRPFLVHCLSLDKRASLLRAIILPINYNICEILWVFAHTEL
jgi:hypothetical protein